MLMGKFTSQEEPTKDANVADDVDFTSDGPE
jgi:hypothetical protein